jgi:hypothetical protein
MIVVGLGKAGCNIAKAFSKFPQYETFTIDTNDDASIMIRVRYSKRRSFGCYCWRRKDLWWLSAFVGATSKQ